MGSDIYMYLEKKNNKVVWKSLDYYKNSDYYDELLYIYDEIDNIEEIIKNSAEYIKKYPKTESGYRYKAGAYIENDKYDEALKVYDDGISFAQIFVNSLKVPFRFQDHNF